MFRARETYALGRVANTDPTMHQHSRRLAARKASNGYALLLVLCFLALVLVAAMAVRPNLLTERRREKEQEMIWRGRQYVRGIRLYYQKTHHFPTDLDDLYKPKSGMRFLRQAYKDPMNNVDGSWRLIYVGPNGQIVGSLRKHTNAFFFGTPAPNSFAGALSQSSSTPFGTIKTPFPSSLNASQLPGVSTIESQSSPSGAQSGTLQLTNGSTRPLDTAPQSSTFSSVSPSTVDTSEGASDLGKKIILGVGSKINKHSVIWLEGEKNYLQFEFMWDGLPETAGGSPSP